MKLILASSGFTNPEIIEACEKMVGKPRTEINFLIINEAIKAESGDHRWFIEGVEEIADNFGGNIEFLDLQAHPLEYIQERIEPADVIFCFGGNTDYLANVLRETGFVDILPEILEQKVWVGSSAGSCVLCHKEFKNTQENIFEEERQTERYLDLVPIFFLPHFHSDWFPQLTEEVAVRESQGTKLPVYLMSDQSALLVTGEGDNLQFTPIGTDYCIAQGGKQIDSKS